MRMERYKHIKFLRNAGGAFMVAAFIFVCHGCKLKAASNVAAVNAVENKKANTLADTTQKISAAPYHKKPSCCIGAPSRMKAVAAARKK